MFMPNPRKSEVEQIIKSVREGRVVILIVSEAAVLREFGGGGEKDLEQSLQDIDAMRKKLSAEENSRLEVYSHVGPSTLSATFCDPDEPDGLVVFNPRWATDWVADKRLFCVLTKRENTIQYNALLASLSLMLEPRHRL